MMRKRVFEAEETASKNSLSVPFTITTLNFLEIQESTAMTRKEKCILCHEETIGTTLFCKTACHIAGWGCWTVFLSVMGKFHQV